MVKYNRLVRHVLAVITKHSPKFLTCKDLAEKLRERHIFVKPWRLLPIMGHLMNKGRVIRKTVEEMVGAPQLSYWGKTHRIVPMVVSRVWGYTLPPGVWMTVQTNGVVDAWP